ncbi:hypothetical protein ANCCAN_01934 [Ancylostoma caninum]|uniref:Uncharacterized protein n=1 Tax=Ancylostoma caninum TaxID=29170 RepID=A0A368H5H8_ANCCA|nr:hypothetical protein ANCCAN_01934 [Ancylostoma caninum]
MQLQKPFLDGDHSLDKDMHSEGMNKDETNQGVAMVKVTQERLPDVGRPLDKEVYYEGVSDTKMKQIQKLALDGNRFLGKDVHSEGVNDVKVTKPKQQRQPLAGGQLLNKNVHPGGVSGAKMKRAKESKEKKPPKNIASRQKTQRKIKKAKTPAVQRPTKTVRRSRGQTLPKLPTEPKTKQKGTHTHRKGHPKRQKGQKVTKRAIKAKAPKGAEFLELVTPLEQHKLDKDYENLERPKSPGYYNLDAFL